MKTGWMLTGWALAWSCGAACGEKAETGGGGVSPPPEVAEGAGPREGALKPKGGAPARPEAPQLPDGIQSWPRDTTALALSGDGRWLAGGDLGGRALLWDLPRRRFLWADTTAEGNRFVRADFASEAAIFALGAAGTPDAPLHVYDAQAVERVRTLGAAGHEAGAVVVTPSGERIVGLIGRGAETGAQVQVWNRAGELVFDEAMAGARQGQLAVWGEAELVAVADDGGGVRVWRLPEREPVWARVPAVAQAAGRVRALGFADETVVVLGGGGGEARGLEAVALTPEATRSQPVTLEVVAGWDAQAPIRAIERADGALAVVTRPAAGGLELYDLQGKAWARLDTGCRCERHALAARSALAICACAERSELRWGKMQRQE